MSSELITEVDLFETTLIAFDDVLQGCEKLHSRFIVHFVHRREIKLPQIEALLDQALKQVLVELAIGWKLN